MQQIDINENLQTSKTEFFFWQILLRFVCVHIRGSDSEEEQLFAIVGHTTMAQAGNFSQNTLLTLQL